MQAMFTLLVSWLLVALVPGLLMLATLGLGRLEKELARDTVTATDVDEFLESAEAVDMHTLAREGMPEALDYLHRRQAQRSLESPPPGRHAGRRLPGPSLPGDLDISRRPRCRRRFTRIPGQIRRLPATRHVNRV